MQVASQPHVVSDRRLHANTPNSVTSDPYGDLPDCIRTVLHKHEERLAPLTTLPPDRQIGRMIPLPLGRSPPFRPMYRMSPVEREDVKKVFADLLAKGFIEPAKSPYGAPILFVQLKDGSLSVVFDYRMLNAATVRDRYPLPRIDSRLGSMHGRTVFL
jgi:hypothetical protein